MEKIINRRYIIYNSSMDMFLKIIHDEIEWVSSIQMAWFFNNCNEIKEYIPTLIGIYPNAFTTIKQIRECYVVPVNFNNDLMDIDYNECCLVKEL